MIFFKGFLFTKRNFIIFCYVISQVAKKKTNI